MTRVGFTAKSDFKTENGLIAMDVRIVYPEGIPVDDVERAIAKTAAGLFDELSKRSDLGVEKK